MVTVSPSAVTAAHRESAEEIDVRRIASIHGLLSSARNAIMVPTSISRPSVKD
jgi:hypothetical protein